MRERKEPEIDSPRTVAPEQCGRGGARPGWLFGRRPEARAFSAILESRKIAISLRSHADFVPSSFRWHGNSSHAVWLDYHGRAGGLFAICFTNLLLMIPTLGLYWFWGRTRLRRYVWGNTTLQGEAFDYTGTGGELLRGFLLLLLLVIAPVAAAWIYIQTAYPFDPMLRYGFAAAVLALFGFLAPITWFLGLRYLISRTQWRAIGGRLHGWALVFGLRAIMFGVVALVSLGLAIPSMTARLVSYVLNHLDIGDRRVRFRAGKLTWLYLAHLCRVLPLLIAGGVVATRVWGATVPDVEPIDGTNWMLKLTDGTDWMSALVNLTLDRLVVETAAIFGVAGIAILLANAWYHTMLYRMMAQNAAIRGLACNFSGTVAGLASLWVVNVMIVATPCGLALAGGAAALSALELDPLQLASDLMSDPTLAAILPVPVILVLAVVMIALVTALTAPILWHRKINYLICNLQVVASDRFAALEQGHAGRGDGEDLSGAVGDVGLLR